MDLLTPDLGQFFWVFVVLVLLGLWMAGVLLGFWIAALLSLLRNDFYSENEKLIWALLLIFVPLIGTILYFTVGIKRIKPQ